MCSKECYELRHVVTQLVYGTEYMTWEQAAARNEQLARSLARTYGVAEFQWVKVERKPPPETYAQQAATQSEYEISGVQYP